MTGVAHFPPRGVALRARTSNSGLLWIVGCLAGVVVCGDLVVGLQWLRVGRPGSPLFIFAGLALLLGSVLVGGATVLTVAGVRRQQYAMSAHGLALSWRTRHFDVLLPWSEIDSISRRYERAPGGNAMGVAVFVTDPRRFLDSQHAAFGSPARSAAGYLREHGTPIYLDLTEVAGGTVRFFDAARWYADLAGCQDLVLD